MCLLDRFERVKTRAAQHRAEATARLKDRAEATKTGKMQKARRCSAKALGQQGTAQVTRLSARFSRRHEARSSEASASFALNHPPCRAGPAPGLPALWPRRGQTAGKPLRFRLMPVFHDNDRELVDRLGRPSSRRRASPLPSSSAGPLRKSFHSSFWECAMRPGAVAFHSCRIATGASRTPSRFGGVSRLVRQVLSPRIAPPQIWLTWGAISLPGPISSRIRDNWSQWRDCSSSLTDQKPFSRAASSTFGHRTVVQAVARHLAHSGSVDGYVDDILAPL